MVEAVANVSCPNHGQTSGIHLRWLTGSTATPHSSRGSVRRSQQILWPISLFWCESQLQTWPYLMPRLPEVDAISCFPPLTVFYCCKNGVTVTAYCPHSNSVLLSHSNTAPFMSHNKSTLINNSSLLCVSLNISAPLCPTHFHSALCRTQ